MVKLNSVGSILDTKTGIVYPQNNDGTPDLNCGVYFEDYSDEWLESISDSDWDKIKKLPSQYNEIARNKNKYGRKTMEKNIIKYISVIQFLLVFGLVFNHFLRDLRWLPLIWLLIPSFLMVVVFND